MSVYKLVFFTALVCAFAFIGGVISRGLFP